jgi:hypothetical protein
VSLPVVTFGRLPQIAAASGGRVTDPYAAADRAAREKAAAERDAAEKDAADNDESGTESDPGTK